MAEKERTQAQDPKAADLDNLEATELDDEDMEDVSGGGNGTCNVNNN